MSKPAKTAVVDAPKPPKAAEPKEMLVIDTTATDGPRTHEQLIDGAVKQFKFEPSKPLALEPAIAAKFLRHPAFQLVDEAGKVVAYARPPRQPEEMGAGEKLELAKDETVARLDELTSPALLKRVVALPGGERFAKDAADRAAIIKFIVATKEALAKANTSREKDVKADEFVPEGELDDEAA